MKPKSHLSVLFCLAALFSFLLLFPFPETQTTFNWNTSFNALHLPLFFSANIGLYYILRISKPHLGITPLTTSIAVFLCGILIEIIQPYFERGFSYSDIGINFLGASTSYIYLNRQRYGKKIFLYSCYIAIIIVSIPILRSYLLYKERTASFPVLFNPYSPLIELASRSYQSKLTRDSSDCGLRVQPSEKEWSGVKIDLGYTNWSDFNYLILDLKNPNSTQLSLILRIDDNGESSEYDQRYNETVLIEPNELVHLEIPLTSMQRKVTGKSFNLKSLDQALIFPLNSANPFCVGKMELK